MACPAGQCWLRNFTRGILDDPEGRQLLETMVLDRDLLLNASANTSSEAADTIQVYYFYQTETLTFLWILFVLIVLGNGSVLLALSLSKNRKSRMNFFIMHLAVADLAVGLINVLTDIVWKTTIGFYAGNVMCKVIKFAQVLVTYSSTYVLVALSIDRYDAITHPLNFSGSWQRARILVASAWGLSAIFSIPAVYLNKEEVIEGLPQCWIDLQEWQWQVYVTLVSVSVFFIPAIIISLCYSIIVYTIWTKSKIMAYPKMTRTKDSESRRSSIKDGDNKRSSSRGVIPRAKIKTVKMTFVIVFVFILCWSPYFVHDLLQVYGYIPTNSTTIALSTFIQSLAPLNSAANPLIYCLFSTHLCTSLRRLPPCNWLADKVCFCVPSLQAPVTREGTISRTDYSDMTETLTRSSGRNSNSQHRFNSTLRRNVVLHEVPQAAVPLNRKIANSVV